MEKTTLDKRVTDACHRIEDLWHETNGKCYVSFSGGKDSTVLLALIKMCQELYTVGDIPAVFSNTGIELGVTVGFVKWCKESGWYPNVQIIYPEVSFDWVLRNKGKPTLSKLKSEALYRWQKQTRTPNLYRSLIEGGARETQIEKRIKNGGKLCTYNQHGMIMKAPVIDWSDEDLEEFIKQYNVPLSDAYTKYGFRRTGCMCCPYSLNIVNDLKYLHVHEPNRYKASMHWLKDVYIAQNVVLPFDESYERERENVARIVRTYETGDVEKVQTTFTIN